MHPTEAALPYLAIDQVLERENNHINVYFYFIYVNTSFIIQKQVGTGFKTVPYL